MDEWQRGMASEAQSGTESENYLAIDIAQDRLAGWKFDSNTTNEKSTAFCEESDRLEGSSIEEITNA